MKSEPLARFFYVSFRPVISQTRQSVHTALHRQFVIHQSLRWCIPDNGLIGLKKQLKNATFPFLISNYVMLTISLLCLLISAISKNSVTPIIITISIVFIGTAITYIPIELFKMINPYLFTGYINSFLKAFHDPIPWSHIGSLVITCTVWSTLFVLLSLFLFNKKDITD